jgi:hypothetical protein
MQEFFRNHPTYKTLAFGSTKRGEKIVAETHFKFRRAGLDAFYRTLRKSPIAYEREAFEAWQKIFPEIRKYFQY